MGEVINEFYFYSKAFVEFGETSYYSNAINKEHKFSSDIPGKVVMPVYRAVKMRLLQMTVEISTLRYIDYFLTQI